MKSILVIFGQDRPQKSKSWFEQFDKIIEGKDLEELVGPGSVQEAYRLVNELSRLTLPDGSRLSKIVNWRGYELWWIHFESIYSAFCLPYTQYVCLLSYLKDFKNVYLFEPPHSNLFKYYLEAHRCQCHILRKPAWRRLLPLPAGVILQDILSIFFLPWLALNRAQLMVWVSDKFAPPHKCDFRMILIYEELKKRKIPFVEFIRSLESSLTVLQHAWQRRRPVLYSNAIIETLYFLAHHFNHFSLQFSGPDSQQRFQFLIASHCLRNAKGTIWSILAIKLILQFIGVKSAIITTGCIRTFHELLACKLANIKTVGIQHGAKTRYQSICDFMSWFDGDKNPMMDQFGVWSNWWREYFIKNSKAFEPKQLYISGPMRPLTTPSKREEFCADSEFKNGSPKVLFISEGLAHPPEVMPYLATLLETKEFDLHIKFRPYRDEFELKLKENQPEVYKKILEKTKILRGTMEKAISQCDVVVGSHSTAVLEALLQLKPFVFFWTQKWGDYFDIKDFDVQGRFFASGPEELIEKIRKSINISKEDLKELQERFFGNPYQNGSRWVVDQIEKFL